MDWERQGMSRGGWSIDCECQGREKGGRGRHWERQGMSRGGWDMDWECQGRERGGGPRHWDSSSSRPLPSPHGHYHLLTPLPSPHGHYHLLTFTILAER